jgi:flavin-dependent dehydrogenase
MNGPVTIVGAGPAGLLAAIALSRAGRPSVVVERRAEVGARFHGDFQGLENWSTNEDVLAELAGMGVSAAFEYTPFRDCVFFDDLGRERHIRSEQPLWYQVRRGTGQSTLDQALAAQAIAAGATIQLGQAVEHLPEGGIVAQGPRRVDAIAVGYVFDTDRADGAYAALSEALAPGGYAYLLICRGRATLATCMFSDFHNEKMYLGRTVEMFQRAVGITMRNARPFGGFGNMATEPLLRRGRMLFTGEAAGLQDALFGFGMRYAMISGHLAGVAMASGDTARYELTCRRRLVPMLRAGTVNRYLYGHIGVWGHRALLTRIARARDPRGWLRRYYNPRWWAPPLWPLARADAARRQQRALTEQCREGCDCTWCRCTREAAENMPPSDSAPALHQAHA